MKKIREILVIHLYTYLVIPLLAFMALTVLAIIFIPSLSVQTPVRVAIIVAVVIVCYYLLKRSAIGAVMAYKAFAPMSMRDQCRFKPTCSTYMIMAIQKYGLFIGVIKGIRRIMRCKPPYGGEDYP